ncbi:MAG TPA: glycosyltransferase family 39 protein [Candidatus Nanoarchaeia archaeon]|nr:glycosyltransferase family 39 protein [Candidatus Nanoarchaeia archaeon]
MQSSKWVWILVGIALVIRLLMLTLHQAVEIDGAYYIAMGENFIHGNGLKDIEGNVNTVFMPLYPILVGIISFLIKNGEMAARLISVIFGALLVLPVYGLAKRFYNEKIALLAALIIAVYPALAYISTIAYADSLYIFLITSAMYFGYQSLQTGKARHYLATGACFSLAYLARPEGWVYIPLVAAYMLWHKREHWKNAIKPVLSLLIIALLIALPYFIFSYAQAGDFSLSSKGYVIYKFRAYEPFSQEYESSIFSLNKAKDDILLNPYKVKGSLIQEILANSQAFMLRYFSGLFKELYLVIPKVYPFIIFSLFAFFLRRWNREELKKESYLLMLVAYPLLFYPVFWVEARYMLPVIPVMTIWAGKGIVQITQRWKRMPLALIVAGILIFSLVGNVFASHLVDSRFEKVDPPLEHKQAGLWVRQNYDHPRIMERKPWVSFYGKGEFVNFPYAIYSDLLQYACNNDVDLIVVDERYTKKLRPQVAFLLEQETSELHVVYGTNVRHQENDIVLYEIDCSRA